MMRTTAVRDSSLRHTCPSGCSRFKRMSSFRMCAASSASFARISGVPRVPISPRVMSATPVRWPRDFSFNNVPETLSSTSSGCEKIASTSSSIGRSLIDLYDSLAPKDLPMKLIVLGSGTSVPHAQRTSSAYWLETSGGFLLLDLGPDAAHRMAEEGLDWANLDAIWISHFHLDHLGGLAPFLFGTKWAPQTQQRTRPLRLFGPAGIKILLHAFDQANNYRLLHQPFAIEVIEIAPGSA